MADTLEDQAPGRDTKVSIDNGYPLPSGAGSPATERAGLIRGLAVCGVLLAAAISADLVTYDWSLRERGLMAVTAILAVIVGRCCGVIA